MLIKENQSLSFTDPSELLLKQPAPSPAVRIGGFSAVCRFVFGANLFSQLPRLLREGAGPVRRLAVQSSNTAQIAWFLNQRTPLNFITSFPRSGNTWMRYMLSDFFFQGCGVATTTDLPIQKVVPDFYCDWIFRRDPKVQTPGILVKTHDSFNRFCERYCGKAASRRTETQPLRRCKHVYIYRSPEDALVSFYHYHVSQHSKRVVAAGIDAFCQAQLPTWKENLVSYLSAAEGGVPVLFIPYELLLQYPAATLGHVIHWLGAEPVDDRIERAVANMRFDKLQAVNGRESMRRGCAGSGEEELHSDTLAWIHERTAHLMERANQRVSAPNWK